MSWSTERWREGATHSGLRGACAWVCGTLIAIPLTIPIAGASELVSESEFFGDVPSVMSVTRLEQSKSDTPAAVTVIDRAMIRASGARDLADVLRLVPGFQVAYARGHRQTVTYHGLGDEFSRRMQILIDGRSVYGALFGHVFWSSLALALEDIDRIEVIRGPNTVTYGSNAFLGTINIITRHAAQDPGTTASVTGGNNDIRDALVRYASGAGSSDVRVTAGYRADDGLVGLPDANHARHLSTRVDFQPSVADRLLVQAGVSRSRPEDGFNRSRFAPPRSTQVDAHFGQARWLRSLAVGHEFIVQVYYDFRRLDDDYVVNDPASGLIQAPVSLDAVARRYDAEVQHSFSAWDHWRFVWGAGTHVDNIESLAFFATHEPVKTRVSRLFGNAEWRVTPAVIANAGAMLERIDFAGTVLSPRVALNYHLNTDHTLRAAWSTARRSPSLFEERGNVQFFYLGALVDHSFDSRGGLVPETMKSYELGYLGRWPGWNTTVDIRVYRDRIMDIVTGVTVPVVDLVDNTAVSFRNEGNLTLYGADMEVTYRPNSDSRVVVSFARMAASGSELPADALGNLQDRLDSVPDYSASVLAMHRLFDHWTLSAGYYWADDIRWLGNSRAVDAYRRLDVRVARRLQFGATRGDLALVVQNLGPAYDEFEPNHEFERRVFATLRFDVP